MPFDARPVGTDGKSGSDARQMLVLQALNFTAAVAEGSITLTPVVDGVAGTTLTSYVIPSGKRLVLLALTVVTRNAGAAVQGVRVAVRTNPTGATVATSPAIGGGAASTSAATANVMGQGGMQFSQSWPALIEIVGDGTKSIGISQIGTATAGNDVFLVGYLY